MKRWLLLLFLSSGIALGSGVTPPPAKIGGKVQGVTTGSVLFGATGSTLGQSNATFFYDVANGRLGLGTATPTNPLQLVQAAASGTGFVLQMTTTGATGNGMTIQHSGSGRGMLIQQTATGTGRGLEITSTNASNTNPLMVLTATQGAGAITSTSSTATPHYTATFNNLSTTMTSIGGGVYGSTRTASSSTTAGVVGEVIGTGIGYGFFAVRNSAGQSLGLATNLGAGVGLSPSYAMSPANNYNLTMPLTQGGANTTLSNDGTGILSWVALPAAPSIGGTLTGSTTGRVVFGGAAATFDDDDGLFYDDTNNRLGVGTSSPSDKLTVSGGFIKTDSGTGLTNPGSLNINASTNVTFATNATGNRLSIDVNGKVGVATGTPTELFDVNSDAIRIRTPRTIATSTTTCDQGEISWDADYIYVCIATDTWKRTALATW